MPDLNNDIFMSVVNNDYNDFSIQLKDHLYNSLLNNKEIVAYNTEIERISMVKDAMTAINLNHQNRDGNEIENDDNDDLNIT